MAKIIFFTFISLFIISLNQIQKSFDIVEGIQSLAIQQDSTYTLTFNAKDSGNYVILFPSHFQLLEATGDIHEDVDLREGFYSTAYAQNFTKGNYIKLKYPLVMSTQLPATIKFRIEKINAYFKFKTESTSIFSTMALNDCKMPIYVLNYNPQPDVRKVSLCGKVHSGAFVGGYRTTEFDPSDSFNKDFKKLDLEMGTELSLPFNLNIIKLQCKEPGIISFYLENDSMYGFSDEIGVKRTEDIIYLEQINGKLPANAYIQVFNLAGSTSIDLSGIGGRIYSRDFYTTVRLLASFSNPEIPVRNLKEFSMILSIFNVGETTDKVAKEKENISVLPNERIIIPLKNITDNKYIKITSSVKGFFWEYQYSQTDNINYLPKMSSNKNFKNGNTVYVDNPYTYYRFKTDYYMYISFIHYNSGATTFKFEYTN